MIILFMLQLFPFLAKYLHKKITAGAFPFMINMLFLGIFVRLVVYKVLVVKSFERKNWKPIGQLFTIYHIFKSCEKKRSLRNQGKNAIWHMSFFAMQLVLSYKKTVGVTAIRVNNNFAIKLLEHDTTMTSLPFMWHHYDVSLWHAS